jgi:hypothetical protein
MCKRKLQMTQNDKQSLTALVWEHCPSKYNRSALVVLVKIAGLSSRDGHAFPSVDRLAEMCGVKSRRVRYILKKLKKDGVLKIQSRKGHSNRFFLQADAIRKLPLVIPPKESETPVTPTAEVRDARWLAEKLHEAVSKEIQEAVIPTDWQSTWPAELQKLFDAGHDVETLKAVARFALNHHGWRDTLLRPLGAHGFVKKFGLIHKQWESSKGKVAA